MSFVEIIKMRPDYIGANGRTEAEIVEAENELGITFAGDYREYLREIGLAFFDSHELTGLTNTVRLNVVSVTKEQQKQLAEIHTSWYVVEEAGIDGIVIWQDADGIVYKTAPNSKAEKIANSLAEYIGE